MRESSSECDPENCSYIIQLLSLEPSGTTLTLTVNSALENEETILLENVPSTNSLETDEIIRFKFTSISESTIYFNLIYGEVSIHISNTSSKEKDKFSLKEMYPESRNLKSLDNINDFYFVEI